MIGVYYYSKYVCILMLMTIHECKSFYMYNIVTCIFVIEIACVLLDSSKKKLVYPGGPLHYEVKHHVR